MSKNIYSADYIARELATVTEMKDTYTLLKQLGHEYDRDTYMTAEEAKAFGIIDQVMTRRPEGADGI